MSAGLQGAIESAPVTRLHERRSYAPAEFAVPGGREEEWRFTPLRRLRGLHTDSPPAPTGTVAVETDPAPEVKTFSAERSVAHAGRTFIPADRVSARAYASFDEKRKGSIEVGKLADLVVLGRDPLREDPSSLVTIPVERTMAGGRWTFEA